MWWMVGLILLGWLGRAPGQDSPAGSEQMEAEEARRASDWAIVQFNADIKDFPSWEAFTTRGTISGGAGHAGDLLYV